MDLRVKKTRSSIINAFLILRAKKPIEKITVTELSKIAEISKGTFYLHFKDVYDLSDQLETDVVNEVLKSISQSVYENGSWLDNIYEFTKQLTEGFISNATMINRLFEGQRANGLTEKIEALIIATLKERQPELVNNAKFRTLLVYTVYGSYYAYKSGENNPQETLEVICKISQAATDSLKESLYS